MGYGPADLENDLPGAFPQLFDSLKAARGHPVFDQFMASGDNGVVFAVDHEAARWIFKDDVDLFLLVVGRLIVGVSSEVLIPKSRALAADGYVRSIQAKGRRFRAGSW